MRALLTLSLTGMAAAGPALAADLAVTVEIPRLTVAEYHRPYLAVWIERPDQSVAANLAVLYDTKLKDREGEKWLKDLRQWWRRTGRELDLPADGVTGPTKPPGEHRLEYSVGKGAVPDLPPGDYALVVEAAREVGGRELLRLPFTWPATAPVRADATGAEELGRITLELSPR